MTVSLLQLGSYGLKEEEGGGAAIPGLAGLVWAIVAVPLAAELLGFPVDLGVGRGEDGHNQHPGQGLGGFLHQQTLR